VKKGALFTMEAFIAVMIVFVAIFFLYSEPVDIPDFEGEEIKREVQDCLRRKEISSEMREAIKGKTLEEIDLEDRFNDCLSSRVEYEVVACNKTQCTSFERPDTEVFSSGTYLAGDEEGREPMEIIIYGWKG